MRLESQAELYFLSHVPWCRAASAWRRDAIFEFPEHVIWSRNGPAWGVVLEIPIPETEESLSTLLIERQRFPCLCHWQCSTHQSSNTASHVVPILICRALTAPQPAGLPYLHTGWRKTIDAHSWKNILLRCIFLKVLFLFPSIYSNLVIYRSFLWLGLINKDLIVLRLLVLLTVLGASCLSLISISPTVMFISLCILLQCFLLGVSLVSGGGPFSTGGQTPALQDISTLCPFQ